MKRAFKIALVVLAFVFIYGFYTFYSTGYFRNIEPIHNGKVLKKISMNGPEDIQIIHELNIALVSSYDRAAERDGNPKQGHIYLIDLKDPEFSYRNLTKNLKLAFRPHGIHIFKIGESLYQVYAVNHINNIHSIELFLFDGNELEYIKTFKDPSMIKPNDVVAIGNEKFYFTNDHRFTEGIGKLAEEYLGLAISNVIFYNGETYREVADGFAYANGINYDANRNLLFVASPRDFKLKIFKVSENYNLKLVDVVHCGTGVDNIDIDNTGKLWIGGHPNLLVYQAYAKNKRAQAPSEIIKIDFKSRSEHSIETIFLDDGEIVSGSTVATVYNQIMLIGNVMDDKLIIWQMEP